MRRVAIAVVEATAVAALLLFSCLHSAAQEKYEGAFSQVRDSYKLEVYPGCLKGPEGVRRDGSGSSLDRALLLSDMLERLGYKPRLANGRLSGVALDRVAALAFGAGPVGESAIEPVGLYSFPQHGEEIIETLRNHYWVQIEGGEGWIDLDPTLPDSLPGQSLASMRKFYEKLPGFLHQRLEISVFCEFRIGTYQAQTRLLFFSGYTQDLLNEPVILLFANQDSDGQYRYASENRFSPVIYFGGKIFPSLNLKAEAARLAASGSDQIPKVLIDRLWIELSLKTPGLPDADFFRLIHTTAAPQASRLDEMIVFSFFLRRSAGREATAVASGLDAASGTVAGIEPPQYPWQLSENESRQATDLLSTQRILCSAAAAVLQARLQAAADWIDSSLGMESLSLRPGIMAVAVNPKTGALRTDLIYLSLYPLHKLGQDGINRAAARFCFGAAASALEGGVLQALSGASEARNSRDDALAATLRQIEAGSRWKAVSRRNSEELFALRLPAESRMHMAQAVESGKVLFVPFGTPAAGNPDLLTWWELDAYTGDVLGMIHPGIGGAQQKAAEEWAGLAAAYAPSSTPGWGGSLAGLCRSLAEHIYGNPVVLGENDKAEAARAILTVRKIMADALSESGQIEMAPEIARLLSDEGAFLLISALGAAPESREPGVETKISAENTDTVSAEAEEQTPETGKDAKPVVARLAEGWPIDTEVYAEGRRLMDGGDLAAAAARWRNISGERRFFTLSVEIDCSPEVILATYSALRTLGAPVFLRSEVVGERVCYRVCVGVFPNRDKVYQWVERVREQVPSAYPFAMQIESER
jgi:hypothetical protein